MVRQASWQDLPQIATVHSICFPDSFSTALGEKLLVRFYGEYMKEVPELFLVAEAEGKVCGFCMGYYCENNLYMKRFFKHNPVQVGLRMIGLLLTGNKAAWKKVKGMFAHSAEFEPIGDLSVHGGVSAGDLLSICVLSSHRGSGAAQALISQYERVLCEQGREECTLTVAVDNPRAIRFYERNGYVPYKEAAGIARTYFKKLD